METELDLALWQLRIKINLGLDRIHDEALAKFRALAKSTGQRTRWDRLQNNS